jgi:TolA-binding protein
LPSPPPALIAPSAAGPSPSWRALAAGGKYKEALERADGEGFDALLESEGSPDLLTLADAARLAGSLGQASRAYLAVRRRFPGSRDAAIAAWNLGRLAFDQRGAFKSAARWFRTYLAEQPSGAFARDASGRLVEALDRAGDAPGAREAARIYLESWPRGPHAEKAHSLLEKR